MITITKISVILPTINEEKGVGATIDSIKRDIFKQNNWELEIIIVDDASLKKWYALWLEANDDILLK